MATITLTPISGAHDDGPPCYLLEIDDFVMLPLEMPDFYNLNLAFMKLGAAVDLPDSSSSFSDEMPNDDISILDVPYGPGLGSDDAYWLDTATQLDTQRMQSLLCRPTCSWWTQAHRRCSCSR